MNNKYRHSLIKTARVLTDEKAHRRKTHKKTRYERAQQNPPKVDKMCQYIT